MASVKGCLEKAVKGEFQVGKCGLKNLNYFRLMEKEAHQVLKLPESIWTKPVWG